MKLMGGSSVSLDIGTAAIRVIELKHKKGGRSTLVNYASTPVPVSQQDGSTFAEAPDDILISTIKQAIADSGIKKREVSIGVPTNKTFSVIVDLPKLEKADERAKVIPIQAEEHIPDAIDSVELDWHVIGDSPIEQGKMEVLLTSIDKNYNAKRIKLVESAGLKVISVEPDAYALPKALVPAMSKQTHVIIESGNVETDLVVVIDGYPRLVRTIPIGAQHIVAQVAREMKVDMAQAQAYVYKFGLVQDKLDGKVHQAVQTIVKSIVDEILKSMKYINNRYGEVQYSDILVSGFSAFIPGISEYIQATAKIPTVPGDAWTNIDYDQSLAGKIQAEKSVFSVAVGLARRLDA